MILKSCPNMRPSEAYFALWLFVGFGVVQICRLCVCQSLSLFLCSSVSLSASLFAVLSFCLDLFDSERAISVSVFLVFCFREIRLL